MRIASMLAGMYLITFTLFALETGCVWKACTFGFVAAGLKSGFSLAHCHVWTRIERGSK